MGERKSGCWTACITRPKCAVAVAVCWPGLLSVMSSTRLELKVERAAKSEPAVQAQSATHKASITSPAAVVVAAPLDTAPAVPEAPASASMGFVGLMPEY